MDKQKEDKCGQQMLILVAWSSIPRMERRPRTLAGLAELLKTDVGTLSRWKYTRSFLANLIAYSPCVWGEAVTRSHAQVAIGGNLEAIKAYYKLVGWDKSGK